MKLIKQIGPNFEMADDVKSFFKAMQVAPGFVFGYVGENDLRPVIFFNDIIQEKPLAKGQERVTCYFPLNDV